MIKLWNKLLQWFSPFVRMWAGLHWPYTHKQITSTQYYTWREILTPGCVILSTTYGEFSNLINPSALKHGALYIGGKGERKYVIEALKEGVIKKCLIQHLMTKDEIVILKPKFGEQEDLEKVCRRAERFLDYKYDFIFKFNNQKFYCFELIMRCYKEIFPDRTFKKTEIVKDKYIFDYTSFVEDPDSWGLWAVSSPTLMQKL